MAKATLVHMFLATAALTIAVSLGGCRSAPLSPPRVERAALPEIEQASPTSSEVAWTRTAARVVDASFLRTADAPSPSGSAAKPSGGGGTEDLAKAAQNPIANMISLPFQNNTSFGVGPFDRTQNVLNIQPVYPLKIGKWLVVNRLIAPVIYQPRALRREGGTTGLGDLNYTAFVVPPTKGKIMWGLGPAVVIPTRTDDALGKGRWGLGPTAIVLAQPGNWVIGAFVQNVWSIDGGGDGGSGLDIDQPILEEEVNQMLGQYFVNYNLPNGWYLTSAPIVIANWKAAPGQKWTVPFGGGFGKIFKIGKQPLNGSIQAYYNAVRPDLGPTWQLRLQLQLLFPTGG